MDNAARLLGRLASQVTDGESARSGEAGLLPSVAITATRRWISLTSASCGQEDSRPAGTSSAAAKVCARCYHAPTSVAAFAVGDVNSSTSGPG